MKRPPYRLSLIILLALAATACIDSKYDLEKINKEMLLLGDSVLIPIGATSKIQLKEMLSNEKFDFLKLSNGEYGVQLDGNTEFNLQTGIAPISVPNLIINESIDLNIRSFDLRDYSVKIDNPGVLNLNPQPLNAQIGKKSPLSAPTQSLAGNEVNLQISNLPIIVEAIVDLPQPIINIEQIGLSESRPFGIGLELLDSEIINGKTYFPRQIFTLDLSKTTLTIPPVILTASNQITFTNNQTSFATTGLSWGTSGIDVVEGKMDMSLTLLLNGTITLQITPGREIEAAEFLATRRPTLLYTPNFTGTINQATCTLRQRTIYPEKATINTNDIVIENIAKEIVDVTRVDLSSNITTLRITPAIPTEIHNPRADIEIKVNSNLNFELVRSSYTQSGQSIQLTNIDLTKPIEIPIHIKGYNIAPGSITDCQLFISGSNIAEVNIKSIQIDRIRVVNLSKIPPTTMTATMNTTDLKVKAICGKVDIQSNGETSTSIEGLGILDNKENVLAVESSSLSLNISALPIASEIELTIRPFRNGQVIKEGENNLILKAKIPTSQPNAITHIVIQDDKVLEPQDGSITLVKGSINQLISTIPQEVKIGYNMGTNPTISQEIDLTEIIKNDNIAIQVGYQFSLPLRFKEEFNLVYEELAEIEIASDIIQQLFSSAKNELVLRAKADNSVPLNLNLIVTPYDINGKILKNINITTHNASTPDYLIRAGGANNTLTESTFELRLKGDKEELNRLRTLGLIVQAHGQQYSTVGAQPLREDNFVQLRLWGKFIGGIHLNP